MVEDDDNNQMDSGDLKTQRLGKGFDGSRRRTSELSVSFEGEVYVFPAPEKVA